MIFIIFSFALGVVLAITAQIANQINSYAGMGISNRKVHKYLTNIGGLSNQLIPIIAIICAGLSYGVKGIVISTLLMLLGAVSVGLVKLSYYPRLMIATFGFPFVLLIYVFSLFG